MTRTGRFQHLSSGGLALLVHGFFILALIFGMSWKNSPMLPVEADLWTALPEPPPPPTAEPEPQPETMPTPPPPVEESKPSEADIALERAEKKRMEEARRLEEKRLAEKRQEEKLALKREEEARKEEARKAELDRQAEQKRQAEENLRLEQERQARAMQEKARLEQEQREQAKQLAKRQMEQELARQTQEELDAEGAQLKAIQQRAKAGRDAVIINDYKYKIQSKIQSYVRLPQKLTGNPEAVFQVSLLPSGDVARVTLVKSSGQPTYDAEVERAILKASPLPLPRDRDAAAVFRDGLTLKFRPFES